MQSRCCELQYVDGVQVGEGLLQTCDHGSLTGTQPYARIVVFLVRLVFAFRVAQLALQVSFVSLKGMIDDIRFLNLLEESHVDFRCIDFPWFCKENLPLIKAVVLYEKLEIRINV
jgi:hypothetical protein